MPLEIKNIELKLVKTVELQFGDLYIPTNLKDVFLHTFADPSAPGTIIFLRNNIPPPTVIDGLVDVYQIIIHKDGIEGIMEAMKQ